MAGELIWAFRVMRLPLLDAGGAHDRAGAGHRRRPRAPGRRRRASSASSPRASDGEIFVNANRLADIGDDGARLRSWDVDLNPFKPVHGEVLVGADVIDQRVGEETVSDVALRPVEDGRGQWWEIAKVRLVRRNLLRRRPSYRLVDIDEVPGLFPPISAIAAEAARLPRHAPGRGRRRSCAPCRSPSAASSPRRWTTSASPTCSRSCPRPSRSA